MNPQNQAGDLRLHRGPSVSLNACRTYKASVRLVEIPQVVEEPVMRGGQVDAFRRRKMFKHRCFGKDWTTLRNLSRCEKTLAVKDAFSDTPCRRFQYRWTYHCLKSIPYELICMAKNSAFVHQKNTAVFVTRTQGKHAS